MTRSRLPRVAALAIALTIAAVIATATRAGGQALPVASVPVVASGTVVCRATAAPSGWYLAAHCLRFGTPIIGGILRPFSADPGGRDIAHVLDMAAPVATLGSAGIGDALAWQSDRSSGTARVVTTVRGTTRPGVWIIGEGGQTLLIACVESGDELRRGDSGTGMGNARGELAALFVGGDLDGQRGTWECGAAQRIFAVSVP